MAPCTEMAKKGCPRLRELALAARCGITQPRTNFLASSVFSGRENGCAFGYELRGQFDTHKCQDASERENGQFVH